MKFGKTVLVGLKGLVVSIITALVVGIIAIIIRSIPFIGLVVLLSLILIVFNLWLWGLVANKLWRWK